MYAAQAQLIFATSAACAFMLLCRISGTRAFAREKFFIGWVLTLCFLLPVKTPLVRLEIPESAAQVMQAEGTEQAQTPAETPPAAPAPGGEAPTGGESKSALRAVVPAVYLLVASLTLFCTLYRYSAAVKMLRRCGRAPTERESEIYARLCERHGLRKNPTLLVCPDFALGSSVTFGTVRQTVIIADKFAEEDFSLILGHELTHCKRKDAVFKAVLALLRSLYWFNPIMHLFIRDMEQVCEQSCDESFLKGSGIEERKRYCRLLIETALSHSAEKKVMFSAFKGGKKIMKQRIENVLGKKSKVITAVLVVTLLLITALTSAIYLATPPENVKVAYFTEPEILYEFRHETHSLDDYICDSFYNVKYDYSAKSDEIKISGVVDGKEFKVEGKFVTTSYNGARILYTGEDTCGNYNVKLIRFQFAQHLDAGELPILDHDSTKAGHNYAGWFQKYAEENPQYRNALQLTLNPVGTDDIIAIEIFIEEEFVRDYVTENNLKYADVDHEIGYEMEFWEWEWLREIGVIE